MLSEKKTQSKCNHDEKNRKGQQLAMIERPKRSCIEATDNVLKNCDFDFSPLINKSRMCCTVDCVQYSWYPQTVILCPSLLLVIHCNRTPTVINIGLWISHSLFIHQAITQREHSAKKRERKHSRDMPLWP